MTDAVLLNWLDGEIGRTERTLQMARRSARLIVHEPYGRTDDVPLIERTLAELRWVRAQWA